MSKVVHQRQQHDLVTNHQQIKHENMTELQKKKHLEKRMIRKMQKCLKFGSYPKFFNEDAVNVK